MSGNKKLLFLMLVLLVLPLVIAADNFKIYSGEAPESICPGSTDLFIDYIENTGSSDLEFTISKSGSASNFATTVPQGFLLHPGQIRSVYTYITPKMSATAGTYDLRITAGSNQGSESVSHSILVKDCYDYTIESLENVKHVCPSDSESFTFRVTNNGQFSDTYDLSVEGEYANSVTLSETQFSLASGEIKDIFAYAQSSSEDIGNYDFTLKIDPQRGTSIKAASATLTVDACYDFKITTDKDLLEFCEHSEQIIPITVENKGSITNTFSLDIKGPEWANLDKNTLEITPAGSGTVNLVLSPDYGVKGNFEIEFSADQEKGTTKALNIFKANIKECHSVNIAIEKNEDRICNSLENTYSITVRNDGQFEKEYVFELDGPTWATLDKSSITLEIGQEEELTLTVSPPHNVISAKYSIKIKATARDSEKIADTAEIFLTTVTKDECYQAYIGIDNLELELYYDSTATAPVVIENRGTYTATYDLSLTGTASDFVYLNPSVVTIEPSKSELVYLYLAPTGQVANGDYSITVSARLGDSPILAAETVNIKITDSPELTQEEEQAEETGVQVKSFFQKIIEYIAGIFKSAPETEEEVIEEETEQEDVTEEETEQEEEQETEEEIDEEVEINVTEINITEINETEINESVEVNVTKVNETEANISEVNITEEVEEIGEELDEVEEEIEEVEEEAEDIMDEITGDTVGANLINSITIAFKPTVDNVLPIIVEYRTQIIGIIIILLIILIAAKTKFHKKIIKFFEEGIEEEPVIEEAKSEEKKEEKPKDEKKEEKKKDDDDEDDFIIEFDDEEEEEK